MRYLRTALSLLLALIVLSAAVSAGAYAASGDSVTAAALGATPDEALPDVSVILGDVDGDGEVTIIDATAIQQWLADLKALSELQLTRADADLSGGCTITDATCIQRYLAGCGVSYVGMTLDDAAARHEADMSQQAADQYDLQRRQIEQRIINYKQTKGVDISVFNGDVNMKKLKAQGYSFVMIRMGYGSDYTSQDDSKFAQNVRNAEAAGLDWGAYLYSYALNTAEAKSEVKHTLRLLKGKKPTMPIAFDIEYDSYKVNNGMPSDQMLHDICLTYLSGIREAGYYPILYTGCTWLKGALYSKQLTGTYDIWLAQWYTRMDYNAANVGMWQYGGETNYIESPYIDGLSGMFDKDYCFKNYPQIITAYGYNNHPAILSRENAVDPYTAAIAADSSKSLAASGSEKVDSAAVDRNTSGDMCNSMEGNTSASGEKSASPLSCDDAAVSPVPPGYHGVMGDSLRGVNN